MKKLALISLAVLAPLALASHDHKPPPMPAEFTPLSGLVGSWEGTTMMNGKEEKATVSYALTSAKTALVETLGPGTEYEMISVYHKDGKGLGMTHYCALGNQPYMKLVKSSPTTFVFEMKKPVGISSMKEPHMHAVTLTLTDKDTLKQEWTHYENGKKAQTAVFNFKRKS